MNDNTLRCTACGQPLAGVEQPSLTLARLASNAMAELNLSYSEAAAYMLRTHPTLARAYRDITPDYRIRGQACIDHHLSNVAINYQPAGFIADRILPTILTSTKSGSVFGKSYYCNQWALKADVTLSDRANADPMFVQQFEEGRVHRVQDALFLDWELRAAKLVMNRENVGEIVNPGTPWTDHEQADVLGHTVEAIDCVEHKTGLRPNRILFSGTAWRHFRRNRLVINKATNPHLSGGGLYPSVRQVEDLLELKVLVGNAWHNAGQESRGLDLRQIWQDHAVVYYAPDQPGIATPSFGYYFRLAAPNVPNMQVERQPYDSRRHCNEVEIGYYQDEVILRPDFACAIWNVTRAPNEVGQ